MPRKYPKWFADILPTRKEIRDRCKDFHILTIEDLELIKNRCNLRRGYIEGNPNLNKVEKDNLKQDEATGRGF